MNLIRSKTFGTLATSLLVLLALISVGGTFKVSASDHDDGENDMKARSLNLTDLYVFREIDQNPTRAPTTLSS